MGKAEERCRVDRIELLQESLIWFEGMPVVVGEKLMNVGFFMCKLYTLLSNLIKKGSKSDS